MNTNAHPRWWKPIGRFIVCIAALLIALFWTFNQFFAGHAPRRFWKIPTFRGLTQEGRSIDAAALAGNVWVTDFIYTRCTSACPTLTARMLLLARRLDPRVHLLSFSVDPGFDRPEVLAAYARRWPAPRLPWTLVAPAPDTLEPLARDMRVLVERNPDDAADITHSTQLFLVDGEGWVRGIYDSQDDGVVGALTADAASIVRGGAPAAPESPGGGGHPAEDGRRLFLELGCNGCHADPRTAPPLGGFGPRQVTLENGTTVVTDRAYLRTSIIEPWAQVVRGYSASMPSYEGAVSAAELDELLAYLGTLPAPPAEPASGSAVDPVCHMKVAIVDATPRVRRGGRTYYFCSSACRSRFSGDPDAYRGAASPRRE